MSPTKLKAKTTHLPTRQSLFAPRWYGLPFEVPETTNLPRNMERRVVEAGVKYQNALQIALLGRQQVSRRIEIRKGAIEGEIALDITEVRTGFKRRITEDASLMAEVYDAGTASTDRLDAELAVPQVGTLAQLCYRSRRFESEGWPACTFQLKEGHLESMKRWVLDIPPEGYLTSTVWTGTPNKEERKGSKRTREESDDGLGDSIEPDEKRIKSDES